MNLFHRLVSWIPRLICAFALTVAAIQPSVGSDVTADVKRVVDTLNEEKIPFREEPLVIGSATAKVTAVFFYAQACQDSEHFLREVFPVIKKRFIDTDKLRLIVYEYPRSWRDMQLLSGLRCLTADNQLAAMQDAARRRLAVVMQKTTFTATPAYFKPVLAKFGITEEQADKCMRNIEIIGHIEGLRKLAVEEWNIRTTPSLLIGGTIYTDLSNASLMSEMLDKYTK
jgi:hypothetical protein